MAAPPGCSLATGSGRTLVGGGVAVAGAEANPAEADDALADALDEALDDALANAVADGTCAVRGAYFSCSLCSALTLSSIAGDSASFSGWPSSVLRSSSVTLPRRAIPEGSWETVGSCTTETGGRSSPLMLDAKYVARTKIRTTARLTYTPDLRTG